MYYVVQTNGENWQQPDDNYWSKHKCNLMGATMLQSKQTNQYGTSNQKECPYSIDHLKWESEQNITINDLLLSITVSPM